MYIDSNIFIFAALDNNEVGKNCRSVLQMVQSRELSCASSYLTIDEIIWVLKKRAGKEGSRDRVNCSGVMSRVSRPTSCR